MAPTATKTIPILKKTTETNKALIDELAKIRVERNAGIKREKEIKQSLSLLTDGAYRGLLYYIVISTQNGKSGWDSDAIMAAVKEKVWSKWRKTGDSFRQIDIEPIPDK